VDDDHHGIRFGRVVVVRGRDVEAVAEALIGPRREQRRGAVVVDAELARYPAAA
jgi:hypothetical protein